MPILYSVPLGIFLVFLIILLLKKNRNVNSIVAAAAIAIVYIIIIQIDPVAISMAKLGPMEVQQNLQKVRTIRDNIIEIEESIDSIYNDIKIMTEDIITTERDLKDISLTVAQLEFLRDARTQLTGFQNGQKPQIDSAIISRRTKLYNYAIKEIDDQWMDLIELFQEAGIYIEGYQPDL